MRTQREVALDVRAGDSGLRDASAPAPLARNNSALVTTGSSSEQPLLPSLLRLRITWKVLAWWTAFYGLASWFLEYAFSQLDPATRIPFWFGLNRIV